MPHGPIRCVGRALALAAALAGPDSASQPVLLIQDKLRRVEPADSGVTELPCPSHSARSGGALPKPIPAETTQRRLCRPLPSKPLELG